MDIYKNVNLLLKKLTIWTHNFLFIVILQKKNWFWRKFRLEKVSVLWLEENSEPCQISMMKLKAVTYFDKQLLTVWQCSTPLMVTVARYSEGISNKTKILFRVPDKKTKSTFILDNSSNYKINYGPNEKANRKLLL